MQNKIKLLYLMGAGRSGTTALATFLGSHHEISTIGEMNQFFEHLEQNNICSCGKHLTSCPIWSQIIQNLSPKFSNQEKNSQKICEKFEYHSSILKLLLGWHNKQLLQYYHELQNKILISINANNNSLYILDSTKYIGRNLSLRKNEQIYLKTIYVVRDLRGVIHSFSKNVQSPRRPLSTILYYLAINITAEIIFRISNKNKIIKVKYEKFVENPEQQLIKIGNFLDIDMHSVITKISQDEEFEIGHIIGGNRLKRKQRIKLKSDYLWKTKQSRFTQIVYYIAALPIMLLNKYKL